MQPKADAGASEMHQQQEKILFCTSLLYYRHYLLVAVFILGTLLGVSNWLVNERTIKARQKDFC